MYHYICVLCTYVEVACLPPASSCSVLRPNRALTVMFEIMKSCGQAFLQHWWVDLFSMVYKIFDVSKFTDVQFDVS